MYRTLIFVLISLSINIYATYAQTPIERLISKYESVPGAKEIGAEGAKMSIARVMIRQSPVAPIASDVEEVEILKMEGASRQYQNQFFKDLNEALKSYDYIGKHSSKNGEVDVYILKSGPQTVRELVVYNPAIYSLNSFKGSFSVDALQKLE